MGWKQAKEAWDEASRYHEAKVRDLDAARLVLDAAKEYEYAARLAMMRAEDEFIRAKKQQTAPARRKRRKNGKARKAA